MLFPIFLLALLRLFRRPGLILIGVGLASLALSIMLSTTHPRAAFYFSFSRSWELLLGAWLAATNVKDFVPRRFIPALQWVGLAMIGIAAASYDRLTPFPGFAALLPCFGTALLIAWSHLQSRVVVALSNPALVWVGLISYPLYLWHLPLLVLARQYLLREPAPHEIAILYLATSTRPTGTRSVASTPEPTMVEALPAWWSGGSPRPPAADRSGPERDDEVGEARQLIESSTSSLMRVTVTALSTTPASSPKFARTASSR